MQRWRSCGLIWRPFQTNRSGSVVINFALGATVLFGVSGLVIDYASFHKAKSALQAAADAGALAAAKEMGMVNARTENIASVVDAVVKNYIDANVDSIAAAVNVQTRIKEEPLEVNVEASQEFKSIFGMSPMATSVNAKSVARVIGRPNVCVLGLDADEVGTISLEQHARVTGSDCAVFSNSSHNYSIKSKNSAQLAASIICSVGGKNGGPGNFSPEPMSDCPSFEDPLANRPEPAPESCLETNLIVSGGSASLFPGTYCGGLKLTNGADVELNPGIYIFKDGPLVVEKGGTLKGENSGLFFKGSGAVVNFAADSTIELTAPEEGLMAGLLMFESRSQPETGVHKISSDNARVLLGTIYLPRGELRVDADSPVADQSAYTAIVSRTMRLYGGPHLVLNTNYGATTIPVPTGIKGVAQPIALVQ